MLTILKTCNVGGLQIHLDGTWINVDAVDGFIVNLGALIPFNATMLFLALHKCNLVNQNLCLLIASSMLLLRGF